MAFTIPDNQKNTVVGSCIPSNINPLSPLGFKLGISKLPNVEFFAQQANLPGISLGAPEMQTPLATFPIPGEMLTFDQFSLQFLVDENMANYKSIVDWMTGLGFPEDHTQYANYIANDKVGYSELSKNFSDGVLQILGSNNVAVQTLQFKDLFPIGIEGLTFNSTEADVNYLVGNATFRYTNYTFA